MQGPVRVIFQQVTSWPWKSHTGQQKWQHMTQKWVETAQRRRKVQKIGNTDSNMASSSIHETIGSEIQIRVVPKGCSKRPHKHA